MDEEKIEEKQEEIKETPEVVEEKKEEIKTEAEAIENNKEETKVEAEIVDEKQEEVKAEPEVVKEKKEEVKREPEVVEEIKTETNTTNQDTINTTNVVNKNFDNAISFFSGRVLQLIGWRILGLLVTVLSLGLLYPLAYCFIYKWEIKHTVINGRKLIFDGKWYQLWGKMICWFFLTIVTFGIYSLWIPIKKNKWIVKHTHYEDTEVSEQDNKSEFDGGLLQLIGWNVLGFFLSVLSLGLLIPFYICLIYNWRIKHTVIDGYRLEFDGRTIQLFGLWIKWFALTFVTFGIYSLWIPISRLKWEKKHTNRKGVSKRPFSVGRALIGPIIVVVLLITFISTGLITFQNSKDKFNFEKIEKDSTEFFNKNFKLNLK